MGIGFVLFLHLIAILILAIFIAILGSVIAYFVSAKERRGRNVITALIGPFVGLYSFYFVWTFGSITVSQYKGIDPGIGDAWYVPLSDSSQLLFIDLPEQAYIQHGNESVIPDVAEIHQAHNVVYVKTYEEKYFSFNTTSGVSKKLGNANEFYKNHNIELEKATDFYTRRRKEITGPWDIIVGIIAILIGAAAVYIMRLILIKIFFPPGLKQNPSFEIKS